MRGMLFMLRASAAYGRVMLIDSTHPTRFEEFLAPAAINWTLAGIPEIPKEKRGGFHLPAHNIDGSDIEVHWRTGLLDTFYENFTNVEVRCLINYGCCMTPIRQ
jgi:hypothetical protein